MSLNTRLKDFIKELGVTFWLQAALLATAALSVESAEWMETPSLVIVAFLAALTAAFMVSLREHRKAHHLWTVLVGGFITYAGGIYLTEADQWYLRFDALHSRVARWWSAVIGEDATTDTLPLAIMLIGITWGVAYFTSWGLLRHRNVWATLLPIGIGIVLTLTYLPERFSIYLFVFLFISLLMLVQVTSLRRRSLLQSTEVSHPSSIHRSSLVQGFLLSAIALGAIVVIPVSDSPATPLKWVFRPMDRVVDKLQEELYRIFVAVPGYAPSSMRFFGPILPLQRPVPTSEELIFMTDSRHPFYWPAIAYDQYTSKAWKVEDTESIIVPSYVSAVGDEEELLTFGPGSASYSVHMYVASPYLLVAGDPLDVDPGAKQEIPASKTFQLDLADPEQNRDLPLAIQVLASSINQVDTLDLANMPSGFRVSKVIKEVSPSSRKTTIHLAIDSIFYYSYLEQDVDSQGIIVGIEVVQLPLENSTVFYKPLKSLKPDSEYRIVAGMTTASEEALRDSAEQYPAEILGRYLQIPGTLPSRVSALTSDIVSGAFNPYDKAVAIETYLRALEYTVASQSIPHDADTVDHFLFESGKGYSDYFASAMAIMLRSQGVPTRLVLGFGPGEENPDEVGFMVRDKDGHSWPEVFFPDIGWVPFEPTPIYEPRARGLLTIPLGLEDLFAGQFDQEGIGDMGGLLEPREEQKERNDRGGPLSGGEGMFPLPERYFGTPLGMGGLLFALFLLIGAILMRALWVRQYGGLRSPQAVYERMHRLVTFLGFHSPSSQTAYEFSHDLSQLVPGASAEVDFVSQTFVRHQYGGIVPSPIDEVRLIWAWRRIKRSLMAQLRQTETSATFTG